MSLPLLFKKFSKGKWGQGGAIPPLFSDSFAGDLSAWTAAMGTAQVAGGKLQGATFGSDNVEHVTNGEFTSDVAGWTAYGGGVLTWRDFSTSPNIAPTGGADPGGAEIANGTTAKGYFLRTTPSLLPRATYKGTVRCYSPSSNAAVRQGTFSLYGNAETVSRVTSEDNWQTLTVTRLSGSNSALNIAGQNSATDSVGDISYWDAFSINLQAAILTRDHGDNPDIHITLTTPTNGTARGYVLRYSDIDTYILVLMISGLSSGNDLFLYQVDSGIATAWDATRIGFVNSTAYTLRIQAYGHSYKVDVDDVNKITYVDATDFNLVETECGPWITDTGIDVLEEVAVYAADPF